MVKSYLTHTHTRTTVLRLFGFCPGQPGWASTRRNIHPLTPFVVINHPLSASSIWYDPRHPLCSIHAPDSLFPQSLSKLSLVYLLAWHPPLHTPYISSPNHCLLFATHDHTIASCFAVVPRLCLLTLVSLSQPFTWNSVGMKAWRVSCLLCSAPLSWFVVRFAKSLSQQESCAIAKMTARCAFVVQYWYRYGPVIKVYNPAT